MAEVRWDQTTLLGSILVNHGVLSVGQLHEATSKQHNSGKLIGEVVQDLGLATSSQIKAALMDQEWRRRSRHTPSSGQS